MNGITQECYDRCDNRGKQACIEILTQYGYKPENLKEHYSNYDIVAHNDKINTTSTVEIEIKEVWDGEWNNDHKTLHMPHRKEKSKAQWYLVFNKQLDQAIIVRMKTAQRCPIVVIPADKSRYSEDGGIEYEAFYDIPLWPGVCRKLMKIDGKWVTIKGAFETV